MTVASLTSFISETAKMNEADASAVVEYYFAQKIIKATAHDGIKVSHGAFLDAEVLSRALAAA